MARTTVGPPCAMRGVHNPEAPAPEGHLAADNGEHSSHVTEEEPAGHFSGWLALPTDCLHSVLKLLSPRELCAVACCSRILRPLAESDAHWGRLFTQRFPRLVLILGRAQPDWWGGGASWRRRFAALNAGAPFHAQVYNREQENDQEDFLLSCYDATLHLAGPSAGTGRGGEPTFVASYLAMGKMPVVREQGIKQQRLRAAPVHCSPLEVFGGDGQAVSEGDEVEVQWKGRRSHPFGWWFGRVRSIQGGRVTLEFVQYPRSSAWRCVKAPLRPGEEAVVNGDSTFGFIGGLRRLAPQEAAEWWQLCPPQRIWETPEAEGDRQLVDWVALGPALLQHPEEQPGAAAAAAAQQPLGAAGVPMPPADPSAVLGAAAELGPGGPGGLAALSAATSDPSLPGPDAALATPGDADAAAAAAADTAVARQPSPGGRLEDDAGPGQAAFLAAAAVSAAAAALGEAVVTLSPRGASSFRSSTAPPPGSPATRAVPAAPIPRLLAGSPLKAGAGPSPGLVVHLVAQAGLQRRLQL